MRRVNWIGLKSEPDTIHQYKSMLLKITTSCPICLADVDWIYDTETNEQHRGLQGCPGGCTAVYDVSIGEIEPSEAQEMLAEQKHPTKLDLS